MCGLTGIFDTLGRRPIDVALLQEMTDCLAHRGPDGDGFHVDAGIGLGHRRLAIIDLKSGDQPIYNDDRSVVIVFNGEIYNFRRLRRRLEEHGVQFLRLQFTDITGINKNVEVPSSQFEKALNGEIMFDGIDLRNASEAQRRGLRGKRIAYGARAVFGPHAHSFFVEPQQMLGMDRNSPLLVFQRSSDNAY